MKQIFTAKEQVDKQTDTAYTLPNKEPLHDYYKGGPYRLQQITGNRETELTLYFSNPMVLSQLNPDILCCGYWMLDWEGCWSCPKIYHHPGKGEFHVEVPQYELDKPITFYGNFFQCVMYGLTLGQDAE